MLSVTTAERCGFLALLLAAGAMLGLSAFAVGSPGAGSDPADLAVTKSDSPDPVATDAVLTYTVEVANAGPDPATGVVLTDDLPPAVELLSATATAGTCDRQGGRVVCELGTIAGGDAVTATIQVRVKRKKGTLSNVASVTSEVTDPNAANDSDTEATTIGAAATCRGEAANVIGTAGNDNLVGTDRADVVAAGDGDDQVSAGGGKDLVCTGAGNDVLDGGSGNDFGKAGSGNDKLQGKDGGDTLKGNRGRDRLRGGAGNDVLAGGKGRDRCSGGSGRDTERGCER